MCKGSHKLTTQQDVDVRTNFSTFIRELPKPVKIGKSGDWTAGIFRLAWATYVVSSIGTGARWLGASEMLGPAIHQLVISLQSFKEHRLLEYYELRRKAKALSTNVQWVQSQPTQIQRQELQIVMLYKVAESNIKPARLRSEENTMIGLLPLLSHVVAE